MCHLMLGISVHCSDFQEVECDLHLKTAENITVVRSEVLVLHNLDRIYTFLDMNSNIHINTVLKVFS